MRSDELANMVNEAGEIYAPSVLLAKMAIRVLTHHPTTSHKTNPFLVGASVWVMAAT